MDATTSKWHQREVNTAREMLNGGSQALQQNQTAAAEDALSEANAILDMTVEDTNDVIQLRARLFNEMGVLHQRKGQTDAARDFHRRAIDMCEELLDRDVDFRGNTAATYLNLSALVGAMGDVVEAKKLSSRAIELVDDLRAEDDSGAESLAVGAYQNMALLHGREKQWEDADYMLDKAVELARELSDRGDQMALPQAAQAAQRLSVMLFEAQEFEDALEWGVEAEQLAESAYGIHGEPVLNIYVISQINLISFHEQMASYADAEDALWKALDVAGNHEDILRRGLAFYENCRKQADNRLESGNLPRQEVEDGLADLKQRIEDIGGLPDEPQR
jgi:tetratricopeptide (TPR) repeat protein